MLLVTVELAPFGDLNKRRILGTMTLVNDGTGTVDSGNYDVSVGEDCFSEVERFTIEKFARERGFWALVEVALNRFLLRN